MLKYTGVKIELIKDINIFDLVNSSILGEFVLHLKIFQMIKMMLFLVVILLVYIHIL